MKPLSPEHRARIAESLRGRTKSPETRAKMSTAHRARVARQAAALVALVAEVPTATETIPVPDPAPVPSASPEAAEAVHIAPLVGTTVEGRALAGAIEKTLSALSLDGSRLVLAFTDGSQRALKESWAGDAQKRIEEADHEVALLTAALAELRGRLVEMVERREAKAAKERAAFDAEFPGAFGAEDL